MRSRIFPEREMFSDIFDATTDDSSSSGYGSSLTSQILRSVTQLGSIGIVAATSPAVNTANVPYGYSQGPGGTLYPTMRPTGTSTTTTLLLLGALAIGAIFLLKK